MSILPKNELKEPKKDPQNFFIYGETMGGKSYLASEFPNPLFLDTDGNAETIPHPSVPMRNVKKKKKNSNEYEYSSNVIDTLDEVVTALQTEDHTFETLVIDVIDDLIVMIEQVISFEAGVDSVGDIGYGKGYATLNRLLQQLVIDLKQMPMNIIYISRINSYTDEFNNEHQEPSLKEKYVNIVNGNCDLMIHCEKIGKNYLRNVKKKRKNYQRDQIQNNNLLKILDSVTGVFERSRSTPIKKQQEIVKEREKQKEEPKSEASRTMPKIK